jgi:hypothetical protein
MLFLCGVVRPSVEVAGYLPCEGGRTEGALEWMPLPPVWVMSYLVIALHSPGGEAFVAVVAFKWAWSIRVVCGEVHVEVGSLGAAIVAVRASKRAEPLVHHDVCLLVFVVLESEGA